MKITVQRVGNILERRIRGNLGFNGNAYQFELWIAGAQNC